MNRRLALVGPLREGTSRWIGRAARSVIELYGDATGLRMVELSHHEVAEARSRLGQARKKSSEARAAFAKARSAVEGARARVEGIERIDPRFPALIQKEHESLKNAAELEKKSVEFEEMERIEFEHLTAALERSHSVEREYAERTKWYSASASVIGALLGLAGSTFLTRSRRQNFADAAVLHTDKVVSHIDQVMAKVSLELEQVSLSVAQAATALGTDSSAPPAAEPAEAANSNIESRPSAKPPLAAVKFDDELETIHVALNELESQSRELRAAFIGASAILAIISVLGLFRRDGPS
eukprot:Plantae.Rhodophyta-Purpureofilum_apyrenoidigerum.ctg29140.p2 GENE.Plantae.Rhodophyta-Purpureofilum_apyrenoidigerum.ctg29140~~Plantae.Rhodophyta-Purpureofilum_apyrenoidigerum.ctg29140.p2  ORF type:complete len:297 (+),score=54.41 Plantae.Rhodophyta-Purpureofilum_apyrenoidigerum.ctg29140:161-1051(+)